MKIFIILLTLCSFHAIAAKEYAHSDLQTYVGYKSLNEHPKINRKQLEFLSFYTDRRGPWFEEVNDYLRSGFWYGWGTLDLDTHILELDSLLLNTPNLPSDVLLFRGQSMDWMGRHYSIGEEFKDLAYFSTSSKLSVSRQYAGYSDMSFIMVLYFADTKGNTKGLVLNNNDKEVLLQRGKTFKVMDSVRGTIRRYGLVQICVEHKCDKKIKDTSVKKWWNNFKENTLGVNSH